MIKPNQTSNSNINVLSQDELAQVMGGHGRRGYGRGWGGGGYGHCGWKRYDDCHEGKYDYSEDYEYGDKYEDKYEYSEDKYNYHCKGKRYW